jgi:DNA-binding NarL/FixJ family response regulator
MIQVAIVEDQRDVREGLKALIGGTAGFNVSATYRSMEETLKYIEMTLPQVVLVDLGLPGMSGIQGIQLLKQRYPDLLLVVLSVYDDDDRIFHAMCAGACGYLLKKTPPARLLQCIEEVAAGGSCMSPEVARRLIELFRTVTPPVGCGYDLTPHELRILKLLVQGHQYKTAAAAMGVTVNTISFHVRKIYEKLHVHSKSEAVAKALHCRLV